MTSKRTMAGRGTGEAFDPDKSPHRYAPLLRPASSATLPADIQWRFVEAPHAMAHFPVMRDLPRSTYPHGVVATDRALTREECERFDLRPQS